MEYFLGKVTQQATNYAIRTTLTLATSFTIKQANILLKNVPKSNVADEFQEVQQRLEHKIKIVSPAIDLIELIAARGNTSLESAVSLTKELRLEIQALGQRIAHTAASSHRYKSVSSSKKDVLRAESENEVKVIVFEIKKLISRIEDAVPLINLALTTSGAKLSTQLPLTVSPSRLLQASTFLTAGDTQYAQSLGTVSQIGPTFTLSVYMLFNGHDRPETEEDIRQTTWKEVIHKARVKLRRVPLDMVLTTGSGMSALQSHEIAATNTAQNVHNPEPQIRAESGLDEFAYQIMIIEDYDDDRHHDFEAEDAKPTLFDEVQMAGIREMIPVHEISKIFYADTSKVLNIGSDAESTNPVLLLRRDVFAVPPRRMMEDDRVSNLSDAQSPDLREKEVLTPRMNRDTQEKPRDPWQFPPSLDPEWIALEVYNEIADSESDNDDLATDDEGGTPREQGLNTATSDPNLSLSLSSLNIQDSPSAARNTYATPQRPWTPQIKTSLSLLEMLLRLTSLQQFQQQSHLSIPDELLNFFLEESASTGAGGNESHRQEIRADARRRVGFDPYDESPIKHRGEEYQHGQQAFYDSPSMAPRSRQSTPPSGRRGQSNARFPGYSTSRQGTPLREVHSSIMSTLETPSSNDRRPSGKFSNERTSMGARPEFSTSRPDWLRHDTSETTRGEQKDEGIGTSPGSALSQ